MVIFYFNFHFRGYFGIAIKNKNNEIVIRQEGQLINKYREIFYQESSKHFNFNSM